jgi:hypothetical protein
MARMSKKDIDKDKLMRPLRPGEMKRMPAYNVQPQRPKAKKVAGVKKAAAMKKKGK